MSSCKTTSFTITKGMNNTFEFTIKAKNSTLPMVLAASDTFVAHIQNLSDSSVVLTKPLTLSSNLLSGVVNLSITQAQANALISERGGKEDRYYIKPNYKLVLQCNTTNNGEFIAKVGSVYVD